jgi:hypothetical protein
MTKSFQNESLNKIAVEEENDEKMLKEFFKKMKLPKKPPKFESEDA